MKQLFFTPSITGGIARN